MIDRVIWTIVGIRIVGDNTDMIDLELSGEFHNTQHTMRVIVPNGLYQVGMPIVLSVEEFT